MEISIKEFGWITFSPEEERTFTQICESNQQADEGTAEKKFSATVQDQTDSLEQEQDGQRLFRDEHVSHYARRIADSLR